MDRPLLSICIPTYNRAHYLERCLQNILSQCGGDMASQVEIVVSDNASTDNTQSVADKYKALIPNFIYLRNATNVGFDGNVINSVVGARGEYCWYLGDDDLVAPGALKHIVEFLRHNKPAVLSLSNRGFTEYEETKNFPPVAVLPESWKFFSSPSDFFPFCPATLGVFIFSRKTWLQTDRTGYERMFAYYEIILRLVSKAEKSFVYCSEPTVYFKNDCAWVKNGGELTVFLSTKRLFDKLPSLGFKGPVPDMILQSFPRDLCYTLLKAKAENLTCDQPNWQRIRTEFQGHPVILLAARLVFLLPNPVVKVLRNVKKFFRP